MEWVRVLFHASFCLGLKVDESFLTGISGKSLSCCTLASACVLIVDRGCLQLGYVYTTNSVRHTGLSGAFCGLCYCPAWRSGSNAVVEIRRI